MLDLQAGRPVRGPDLQQLLGGLAEVTGSPDRGDDLVQRDVDRGRDRPDGQLLGQPEVDGGELGSHLALAEIADGRQHLVRRLPEQLGHPVDQDQAPGSPLEIGVRLGDDGIVHLVIMAHATELSEPR